MKKIFVGIMIGLIIAGLLFFFISFGFSDFMNTRGDAWEIWEKKPWRPWARAMFGVTMSIITIVTCGLTINIALRRR